MQAGARRCALAVLAAALPALAGCGGAIVGHWRLAQAIPNRQVFSIDDAHFDRDARFSATTTIEGRTYAEQGRYAFNGFKLKLHPDAGGQREYLAKVRFGWLEITSGDRKAILSKQP